ncbi:hypothetical protein KIN20_016978 [Parelaphostrongylus tenuis]|uniref:Uncharacterized protein n=1 Tax=Parelaphostrongylus tenuis TaxID=148309 RepID=A0AAD5N2J9_PARTN|nr:hypothetical protein KIN20_016978 [Parelaphostrongylus tenuis]
MRGDSRVSEPPPHGIATQGDDVNHRRTIKINNWLVGMPRKYEHHWTAEGEEESKCLSLGKETEDNLAMAPHKWMPDFEEQRKTRCFLSLTLRSLHHSCDGIEFCHSSTNFLV